MSDLASEEPKASADQDVGPAFGTALSAFLKASKADPVRLILLGDLLDLQFSPREDAADTAIRFLTPLASSGHFEPEILATAGNHDHALWTDARAGMEAAQVGKGSQTAPCPAATPAFDKTPSAQSRLLNAVLDASGFGQVHDFRYPNIAFENKSRTVVLHHGHFIESEYALMSHLKDAVADKSRAHLSAEELSAENAGWIDFFWSTTGDALGIGRKAETFYQKMLTSVGFRNISDKASRKIAKAMADKVPFGGRLNVQEAMRIAAQVGLDLSAGAFRDTERFGEVHALSASGREGLETYLTGAVAGLPRKQLNATSDLTFVFGHTHKPFSERMAVEGYKAPVKVFNTGGWTLNGPRFDTQEGASLVLIDDDLNTASLRLFMTPRNGVVPPVHVDVFTDNDGARKFKAEIEAWLENSKTEWRALTQAVSNAYRVRQKWLLDLTAKERAE